MSRSVVPRRRRQASAPGGLLSILVSLVAWAMLVQAGVGNYLHARYHQTETISVTGATAPGTTDSWQDPDFGIRYGQDDFGCPFQAQLVNRIIPSERPICISIPLPTSAAIVAYVFMEGSNAPIEASARAPPSPV